MSEKSLDGRVSTLEARVDGHEDLCAFRYGKLDASIQAANEAAAAAQKAISRLEKTIYGSLIAFLIYLAKTHFLDRVWLIPTATGG